MREMAALTAHVTGHVTATVGVRGAESGSMTTGGAAVAAAATQTKAVAMAAAGLPICILLRASAAAGLPRLRGGGTEEWGRGGGGRRGAGEGGLFQRGSRHRVEGMGGAQVGVWGGVTFRGPQRRWGGAGEVCVCVCVRAR
jgi:hypothetical protein